MKGQQLELDLWSAIATARLSPEEADLQRVLQILDQTLVDFDISSQLRISADALCQITDLFCDRTHLLFAEIQAKATDEGPIMPDDAFNRYVRQTVMVDLEQFIQSWERVPRKVNETDPDNSVVGDIDKEVLLQHLEQLYEQQDQDLEQVPNFDADYAQAISIAYPENVSAWIDAIAAKLSPVSQPIKFIDLEKMLHLPRVELWLGLMLGDFQLEQRHRFYDIDGIWVK